MLARWNVSWNPYLQSLRILLDYAPDATLVLKGRVEEEHQTTGAEEGSSREFFLGALQLEEGQWHHSVQRVVLVDCVPRHFPGIGHCRDDGGPGGTGREPLAVAGALGSLEREESDQQARCLDSDTLFWRCIRRKLASVT